MGRKTVHRALPGLAELLPAQPRLRGTDHKVRILYECLAPLVERLRRPQAEPFYAMRDVARFFRVSVNTVAEIYRQLEQKGLLVRVRSSRTLLAARRQQAKAAIRGVVGLPTWLHGFSALHDWRQFFVCLEEQLRRHHFVADFVFYFQTDFREPDFADRLIAHGLDYLIWFMPHPDSVPIMQTVAEHGVRVVVVMDHEFTCPFPRYHLNWERGLLAAVAGWKRDGIVFVENVILDGDPEKQGQMTKRVLAQARLDSAAVTRRQEHSAHFLRRLGRRPGTGVVFSNDLHCSDLCRKAPDAMADLARRCRILMLRGALDLPVMPFSGVNVDLVDQDWPRLVARLVRDISTNRLGRGTKPSVFHARWWPQVDAGQYGLKSNWHTPP